MKQPTSNRGYRALQLFLGMRDPEVAEALAPFGYNQKVMQDGLDLIAAATQVRVDAGTSSPVEPLLLHKIDEFEDTWFPIVKYTLGRAYPAIAEKFFLNLGQQTGGQVVASVGVFLSRLADLAKPNSQFGTDGPAARKLLVDRGLTAEREAEAKGLMQALTEAQTGRSRPVSAEQQAQAEKDLRLWYLEWSAIAQVAIKKKVLLRRLGFGRSRVFEEDGEADAAPEATTSGAGAPAAPGSAPAAPGVGAAPTAATATPVVATAPSPLVPMSSAGSQPPASGVLAVADSAVAAPAATGGGMAAAK